MQLISDVFLAAGAFGAALYCFVLQRRLQRFTRLESGMGSAIAVLSAQVDDLTRALSLAQSSANGSTRHLEDLTTQASAATARLELLMSSMHDLPTSPPSAAKPTAPPAQSLTAKVQRYRIRSTPGLAS